MAKQQTAFFCKECGFESPKWMGQCPSCKNWNTFTEAPSEKKDKKHPYSAGPVSVLRPKALREVEAGAEKRIPSGIGELDRVLGGGIVPGSFVLIGGDPGIGKSTILLEVLGNLGASGKSVLYVSGEESLSQIKMRADRLGKNAGDVPSVNENSLDRVISLVLELHPDVVVIDSIQTMYREEIDGAPGSVSQVRECTNALLKVAKTEVITVFIVGHVTKEGTVAGPRMLEHMVDTVLYFEGDRSETYRFIRAVKNRFGATNEVGVFEMTGSGLNEVKNPSEYLLSGKPENASGSAVTCVMEGTRPMLLEIQALVAKTSFGLPRRTAVGIDLNRLNLLLAVMQRRASLSLAEYDVYVNLTGGVRVTEPTMDLSVIMAVTSAYYDIPIDPHTIAFGEVGLTGELRGVGQCFQRVKEAVKLGYKRIIIPFANTRSIETEYRKYCMPVHSIREAIRLLQQDKN